MTRSIAVGRLRRRYAARLASGLLAIVAVTVVFGLLTLSRIRGSPTEAEVTSAVLGLILIVVISFGLLGVTIGTNTAITVRQLARRAETMAAGDLEVGLETDREDEFGTLYDSFATMRDSLQERIEAAESAREAAQDAKERAENRQ